MCPTRIHTRIIQHTFAHLMQGARLDSFEQNGNKLILGVQGLHPVSSELFEHKGKIVEKVTCEHIPMKLVFSNITELERSDFFTLLEKYPIDDPSRVIAYLYSWRQPKKQGIFHLFGLRGPIGADMMFFADGVSYEKAKNGSSLTFERDWSPSPPMPDRLVPQPDHIHRRFGGDPITIKIGDKISHRKLFIGGVEIQPKHRPQVNAVLNVGEEPSKWVKDKQTYPSDRWDNKGEGSKGMSHEVIREEANWVIERLQKNQRVLVHCAAGMNRSTTICCAVLILLEGLTTEESLIRVHEHHPWAKPDSHHWLALRWLAKMERK